MPVFIEALDKTGLLRISKTLDDGRHIIGRREDLLPTTTTSAKRKLTAYASDLCLPAPLRNQLLGSGSGSLAEIATKAGVAPAIVAGQYAHFKYAYPQMTSTVLESATPICEPTRPSTRKSVCDGPDPVSLVRA